ncbi:MAG: flagellar motor switch protein FliG [Terriglobales bacterium]
MSAARAKSALSGARKAAILLTVLGEEAAAVICRQLSSSDVQQIAAEVASLDAIPPELAQQVLEEYQQQSAAHRFVIQGGSDYATRLLKKTFGEENGKELALKVTQAQRNGAGTLDWLRNTDPKQLAALLEKEHAQTIALVLAHLEPQHASPILSKLPAELQVDVVKRIAQLQNFSPDAAETISNILNQKLKQGGSEKKAGPARPDTVPGLMNQLEPATSRAILDAIEKENAELAGSIRNLMFTFEDLIGVPETALRDLLGAVDKKTLALALKGASDPVKEHIFKAMSSRAVEMLKEDMDVLGRVRGKDVAKAQQEVIAAARQLEAEGKITLRAEADDEFVA